MSNDQNKKTSSSSQATANAGLNPSIVTNLIVNAMSNATDWSDLTGPNANFACTTPDETKMDRVCARFLSANVKKTPAMIELLKKKDKTKEEEAEVMAAIGMAVRETMKEMGVAEEA